MANRFEFLEIVGPREQVLTAFERLALKIGAQAVGQHRDVELVGDLTKLEHLIAREELSFVDQHAMQRFGGRFFDDRKKVVVACKGPCFGFDADTRGDFTGTEAIVELRCEHQRIHAALAIVVTGLQQRGGLTRVHRGIVKVQLGHGHIVAPIGVGPNPTVSDTKHRCQTPVLSV